MKVSSLAIRGVLLIEPTVYGDERGFFFELPIQARFNEAVGTEVSFVQDNHSKSAKGVLRELHYQISQARESWCGWSRARSSMFPWTCGDPRRLLGSGSAKSCRWTTSASSTFRRASRMASWFCPGTAQFLYKTTGFLLATA